MNRIKELREAHKLSLHELGKIIGVSRQAIFNWENEFVDFTVKNACKLANYFNVSVDYLLGRAIDWRYLQSVFKVLSKTTGEEIIKIVKESLPKKETGDEE